MHRRIVNVIAVALLAVAGVALVPVPAAAQKLVILVRHAERADGGSMSASAQTDPPLSAAGEERAKKLAAMLADAGVKAIYATEFKRTQDTVRPLAQKLGVTVEAVPGREAAGLIAKIKAHANDVVLVAGHSNTVPATLKALGGPDITIADSEYDNILIFVPATGAFTRIRF